MNDTTPTTSPRPKGKKNKIRPKLKPIVSTDDDDDEGLGYGNWKILGDQNNKLIASRDNNMPTTTTTTTTTSPQPKTKKKKNNKIRPKVKPIVSTDDDDDEGLGYGEWAASSPTKPSPIKPRQVISSERSGNSEEQDDDEKKVEDEDTIHVIRKINSKLFLQQQHLPPPPPTNEKEEKVMIIQPEDDMTRLDNNNDVVVASSSSRPITLQSKQRRDFDHNKLQFFENNITSGGEKIMKVSDNNRAKTTTTTTTTGDATTHTTRQQNVIYQIASELESELLEAKEVDRKWLYYWSRIIIWKGAILLLCIALCWKVLLRITEMSLSHNNVELSSSTIGEALSWWNKEVVSVTATTMDENIAGEVLWSSRGKKEDVPDDIKLAGMEEEEEESVETTIEDVLPSEEATMSASSVVDDDPEENQLVKSREDATDDGIIHSEIEISLSTEEERETHESRHYDYPSTQDAEGSESGVSEQVSDCEVEEHIILTARADNNLVEIEVGIKVEAFFDKNEQQSKPVIKPIVEATDGYEAASTVPGGNTIQAH